VEAGASIGEDDDGGIGLGAEGGVGGEAGGGAAVIVGGVFGAIVPGKGDMGAAGGVGTELVRGCQCRLQSRVAFGVEVGGEIGEHVPGGGADGTGACEGVEVPGVDGEVLFVVALEEALLLTGREVDGGIGKAEGGGNLVVEMLGVGLPRPVGEGLAEEAEAEIAVAVIGIGRFGDTVGFEIGVELGRVIIGVGVGTVNWPEVGGHAGEARAVGGEIEEGDFGALRFGDGAAGEELADGFVVTGFAFGDHTGEQEAGEGFGDRPDFEERVRSGDAVGHDLAFGVAPYADGDAGVWRERGHVLVHDGGDVADGDGGGRGGEGEVEDGGGAGVDGEVDGPEEAHGGVEQEDGQAECGRGGGDFGEEHSGCTDRERGEDEDVAAVREGGIPAEDGEEADGEHGGGDQEVLGDQGEDVALGVRSFRTAAEDGAEGTENGEEDE
jgi:hypothetical protein